MISKIMLIIFILSSYVSAADLYIATDGTDSGDCTGADCLTLEYAVGQMSASDTLTIRDGTYSGATNTLDGTHLPPSGTSENYTIIKAENDGQAVFSPFIRMLGDVETQYIQLEGIRSNDGFEIIGWDYFKILRSFIQDGEPGGDNTSTAYINECSYGLIEDSAAWGSGRYKFQIRNSDHMILRRCLVRFDVIDTTLNIAGFCSYASNYISFQNCIVIDSDQSAYWTHAAGEIYGSYGVPHISGDVSIRGSISINNNWQFSAGAADNSNFEFTDIVSLDDYGGIRIQGYVYTIDHFTVNNITPVGADEAYGYGVDGYVITPVITNSVVQGCTIAGIDGSTSNYNSLFDNTDNFTNGSEGANDYCSENSNGFDAYLTNILYPVRIETGTTLADNSSDGKGIGATILKRHGTSGTLHGETGWDTLTTDDLWPFPNENLIKTQLEAYEYDDGSGGAPEITGARGAFSGDANPRTPTGEVTLTSYIWEYLGNNIPADIYNIATTPTINASFNCSIGTE